MSAAPMDEAGPDLAMAASLRAGTDLFMFVDAVHFLGWETPKGALPYTTTVTNNAALDLVRWTLGDTTVPLAQRHPESARSAAAMLKLLYSGGRADG